MANVRLEFRILGPLSVRADGIPLAIGGPKQRALLALLLLSPNRVVSRDRLTAELFGEQSPASADHALRNHVSRLRKVLAQAGVEPRLAARPPGYLLRVEPGELDLEQFEQLVHAGREALAAGDAPEAVRALRAAMELWEGRPLADLEFEPFARIEVERLEELRLAATEERIDAELALGRHLALIPEIEAASAEHPLRERFRAQLMLALYRSGRQAESLEVYRRTRRYLNDELGLEPGTELQELERAILVQDAALAPAREPRWREGSRALREGPPFKGPLPFQPEDAELFFGRERLIDEIAGRLTASTLLALVGPSGSGKSSLLRAGLLPGQSATAVETILMRPGGDPASALVSALGGEPAALLDRIPRGGRAVLAVDQLEEVFSTSVDDHDRAYFLDALADLAWDPERRVLLLVALRADHFGRLAAFPELADLVSANHVLLGPLGPSEIRRAIEGPARLVGLEVEPELVDALVDETAHLPGGLPLLSTVLLDLWLDRRGATLTLDDYARTGGVRGSLARHADASLRSLTESERRIARRVLPRLVAGGDGEPLARRALAVTSLGEDAATVVERLVERRLLVTGEEGVELSHDALLESWPTLERWLAEDAEDRRQRRRLERAAAEWERTGRIEDVLLRGAPLAAAVDWADAEARELPEDVDLFLTESRHAATREARRQRQAIRRLRGLLLVAGLLTVGAVGAGAVALVERGAARSQATAAIAGRLGAQALVEPRVDRSLLLARAAVALDDSSATRSDLLAALLRTPGVIGVMRSGGHGVLDDALSPDGRTLAVETEDGTVTFFDTGTRRELGPWYAGDSQLAMAGGYAPLHDLAFSRDGRLLAIGSTNGTTAEVDVLNARTHEVSGANGSGNAVAADVAFAPGGRTFATGEGVPYRPGAVDEQVTTWRSGSVAPLRSSRSFPGGRLIGYVKGGREILVALGERRSVLLDAATLRTDVVVPDGGVAAIDAGGDLAAFGHASGAVDVLNLGTGKRDRLGGGGGAIVSVTFGRSGAVVAAGSADGAIAVWDVARRTVLRTFIGPAGPVGLQFSPDGRTLYSGSGDGSVLIWDVSGERGIDRRFLFSPSPARGVQPTSATDAPWANAVTRDGSLFATSPGGGRVTLWRSSDDSVVAELHTPVGGVFSLAFSPDRRLLAVGGTNGDVLLVDLRTKRVVRRWTGNPRGALVRFSPNGDLLGVGGNDGRLRVFDVRSGDLMSAVEQSGSIQSIAFSPDGALLASGTLANEVLVWNVARRRTEFVATTPSAVFSVAFSPDGRTVATAGSDGAVYFWNARTGKQDAGVLAGQNGYVTSVSFDPKGGRLVTTSHDGRVRLWDLATRSVVGSPMPGDVGGGWSSFFPDGRRVLVLFNNGTGDVWSVDPASWAAVACGVAGRPLSRDEWAAYVPHRPYREICG